MATATHDWWTILKANSAEHPDPPPVGPWPSREEAENALRRWADRHGANAGQEMNRMNVRIDGPFCTRSKARDADISDAHKHRCPH